MSGTSLGGPGPGGAGQQQQQQQLAAAYGSSSASTPSSASTAFVPSPASLSPRGGEDDIDAASMRSGSIPPWARPGGGVGTGSAYEPSIAASTSYFSLYSASGDAVSLDWDDTMDPSKTVVLQPTRQWKKPKESFVKRLPFGLGLGRNSGSSRPSTASANPSAASKDAEQSAKQKSKKSAPAKAASQPAPAKKEETIHIAQQNESGYYTISEIPVSKFNELYGEYFANESASMMGRRDSLSSFAYGNRPDSLLDAPGTIPGSPALHPTTADYYSSRPPSRASYSVDLHSASTEVYRPADALPLALSEPASLAGGGGGSATLPQRISVGPGRPNYTELDLEIQQLLMETPLGNAGVPAASAPFGMEEIIIDDSIIIEDIPPPLTASSPALDPALPGLQVSPSSAGSVSAAAPAEDFLISQEAMVPGPRGNTERSSVVGSGSTHRPRDSVGGSQPATPTTPTVTGAVDRTSTGTSYSSKRNSDSTAAQVGSGWSSAGTAATLPPPLPQVNGIVSPPPSGFATPIRPQDLDIAMAEAALFGSAPRERIGEREREPRIPSVADDPLFQSELAKLSEIPDDFRLTAQPPLGITVPTPKATSPVQAPTATLASPPPSPAVSLGKLYMPNQTPPPTIPTPQQQQIKLDGPPVIPPTSTEIASTFRGTSRPDSLVILGIDPTSPLSTILEAAKQNPSIAEGYKRGSKLFDWEELMAEAKKRVEMDDGPGEVDPGRV